MLFLAHFSQYYSVQIKATIHYHIDNDSALKTLIRIQDGSTSNRVLPSNNDLLSVLQAQRAHLQHIHFHHVHSHQDEQTNNIDALSLPAKINILCDRLATQYYQRYPIGEWAPFSTPLIPISSPITITIAGNQLSSHYAQQLRLHIARTKHVQYLLQSKHWTPTTLQSVDLDGLRRLHHKKRAYRLATLSKLQHGWLNLGTQRSRYLKDDPDSSKCPCCSAPQEDFVHLLTCTSTAMQSHRYSNLTTCLRQLDSIPPYNPPVANSLRNAIHAWIKQPSITPQFIATGIPIHLRNLVQQSFIEQNDIGWDNLFRGYISKTWAKAFATRPNGHCQQQNIENYSNIIISVFQQYSISTWEARNKILHDNSPDNHALVNATINHKITNIYSSLPHYPLTLRDMQLFEPLATLLGQSTRYRTQWLHQATMLLESSQRRSLLCQHLITNYYNFDSLSISTPRANRDDPHVVPIIRYTQTSLHGNTPIPNLFPHRLRRIKRSLNKSRDKVNRLQLKITNMFQPRSTHPSI